MQIFSKMIVASSLVLVAALQTETGYAQNNLVKMTNPLLQKSTLQYQAPNFNLIKDEHFGDVEQVGGVSQGFDHRNSGE